MALKTEHRWLLLGGALLLTVVAIVVPFEHADDNNVVELANPDRPAGAEHKRENKPEIQRAAKLDNAGQAEEKAEKKVGAMSDLPDFSAKPAAADKSSNLPLDKQVDLFKQHAWYVPPPPPKPVAVVAQIPVPVAPPLPYFYMGKMEDTPEGTLIFLSSNNKVMSVKVGAVIDRVWHLDKESANAVQFTYVPLSIVKTLSKLTKQPSSRIPSEPQGLPE